jgi:branched-chain amino acid transport system ATP-binding protein
MTTALVEARDLCKRFGGVVATDRVSLSFQRGQIHALIGPNGAGKTTLVNLLSGELASDAGQILLAGEDITYRRTAARARLGLARSFQITSVFQDLTVLDNVALAAQATQRHSFRFWRDARKDKRLRSAARETLVRIGLEPRADTCAAELSHGEHRQLELAMALATRPRVLLLDEPMAGMGHEESLQIIRLLHDLKPDYAILLVEHDMNAVFATADLITVLVYGRVLACGTPEEIRANPEVRLAYLGEEKRKTRNGQREVHHY